MKTHYLILLLALCITVTAKSQICTAVTTSDQTLKLLLNSPVKKKVYASITDAAGNIKWAKKVKVKKGLTEPRLFLRNLAAGIYIVRIGDFFKKEIRL